MGYEIGRGGLSAQWLAEACGGEVYTYTGGICERGFVGDNGASVTRGLCSNTREIAPGEIFIAIHGERFDGHSFISDALEKGAYAVICDSIPDGIENGRFILTSNTEDAFLEIAKCYKKSFPALRHTIAVTGSVGKTTTKQFIYSVLSAKYNTHKTPRNFNNLVGLPITALQLGEEHEAAVLEMGMNSSGEISRMSRAAEPDIGVITNVGTAHIGMLGSREAIRDAKMEITHGFGKNSILIRDGDETLLSGAGGMTVSFIDTHADVYIDNVRELENETVFDLSLRKKKMTDLYIPVIGKHNVFDAAVACTVGDICGLSEDEIRRGLASFENTGSRQKITDRGGITVIEDCYNASPESMKASLGVLRAICEKKRTAGEKVRCTAVLGSMFELGDKSPELHRTVGNAARENGIELLFTIGDDAREYARALNDYKNGKTYSFDLTDDGKNELCDMLRDRLTVGDVLLFKASHSVGLDDVIARVFGDHTEKHQMDKGKKEKSS